MAGNEPKIITIDRINGNFYGGFPFIANWNFNDGSEPSTLTVSVVNSAGRYSISDSALTYKNTVAVLLGQFTFNGYLIGYDIEESAQQNILTLEYIDKSVDLSRWNVGLNNRHGQGDKTPNRMILVGREYGVCEKELDSTGTFGGQKGGQIDPCDPCPNMPANGYKNACQDSVTDLQILPVYYTFNELLDKLGSELGKTGLTIVRPTDLNGAISNHRGQYVGTVKSVLSTWCAELGLSYYFDPVDQKLVFVNRGSPLSIPDKSTLSNTSQTISLKYGATRSNTFSRGFIGYLGTQGEIKNYNCDREDAATLRCLTLSDLITEATGAGAKGTGFNAKEGGSYDKNHTYIPPTNGAQTGLRAVDDMTALFYSTALAYYPSQVRFAFIWFYVLGIYDETIAKSWRTSYVSPNGTVSTLSGNGTTLSGSTIYEYGNMNIIQVYSKQDSATREIFDELDKKEHGLVPDSYRAAANREDALKGRTADNPSYYFILAQCNIGLLNRQEERDQRRAKEFLGRYYYRSFNSMAVAGNSNDNDQLNIDAAGASCSYHPRGSYIQQLPIFSFGHTGKSTIGKIVENLGQDDSDNIASIGKPSLAGAEKYRSLSSFILLDRADAAKFKPHESEFDDWKGTWDWYDYIAPHIISNDGRPSILLEKNIGNAKSDTSLKLFLVRSVDKKEFNVAAKDGVKNPWESTTTKTRHKSYEGVGTDGDGSREHPADGDNNASYGLLSADTVEIRMPGGLVIKPPAQSLVFDGKAGAGFRVFIKSSAKYQKVIPKFQKVAYVDAADPDNVAQVDYIYKELSTENLVSLTGQETCMPTDAGIKTYVDKFAPYMAVKNTQVSHKANLKLLGVMPTRFTVSQGLSSVQITVGDNGVYTDYTFEDKVVTPPSEDVIAEQVIRQNRIAPTLGSSLQKMTGQQYDDVGVAIGQASAFNTNGLKLT